MQRFPLACTIYIPPRQLAGEWLEQFFHRLWEHGLHFGMGSVSFPTWDEELRSITHFSLRGAQEESDHGLAGLPLINFLQLAQDHTMLIGSIEVWDKDVGMHLRLDPSGARSREDDSFLAQRHPFGEIELWVDGAFLRPEKTLVPQPVGYEHGRLLRPAQQMLLAFTHWVEVLCVELGALFAAGYDPILDQPGREYFDRIHQMLARGQVPTQDQWQWLTYVAPQFITNERLAEIYNTGKYWLKKAGRGGLLAVHPLPDYRYEASEAFAHQEQGFTLEHPDNAEQLRRATLHYERAREIFAQIPNENMAAAMEDALARIRAELEMSQQDAVAQQIPKSAFIRLESSLSLHNLGQQLEKILGITGKESLAQKRFMYILTDIQKDKQIRISLQQKDREKSESQRQDDDDRLYHYALEFKSAYAWQHYSDPYQPLRLVRETARDVFERLKATRQYRLTLSDDDGETIEVSEV